MSKRVLDAAPLIKVLMDLVQRTPLARNTRESCVVRVPSLLGIMPPEIPYELLLTYFRGTPELTYEVYEKLVWWKLGDSKVDRATISEIRADLKRLVGAPLSAMIVRDKDGVKCVLAYVWAMSIIHDLPLHLTEVSAYIEYGPHTLGVFNGKLVSAYVKNKEVRNCRSKLGEEWSWRVYKAHNFISVYVGLGKDEFNKRLLVYGALVLGAVEFNRLFATFSAKSPDRLRPRERYRLHSRCTLAIKDPKVHPLKALREILVPAVLSSELHNTLFGKVTNSRLPGVIKRRRLQKTIDTLFLLESEKNDD